ncbi:MAG: transmembrane sensor, partial [Polaribacter sp.]
RGGNLFFRGESLEKIIEEIERYTQVEFEIFDEDLKRIRVAGLFKAGDVKGLLETLEKNFNVTNKKIGNNKILLSNYSDKTD